MLNKTIYKSDEGKLQVNRNTHRQKEYKHHIQQRYTLVIKQTKRGCVPTALLPNSFKRVNNLLYPI